MAGGVEAARGNAPRSCGRFTPIQDAARLQPGGCCRPGGRPCDAESADWTRGSTTSPTITASAPSASTAASDCSRRAKLSSPTKTMAPMARSARNARRQVGCPSCTARRQARRWRRPTGVRLSLSLVASLPPQTLRSGRACNVATKAVCLDVRALSSAAVVTIAT